MPHINLDNSKRSTFASCPKKYYWNYVRHLQSRYGAEPLIFGKVYHALHEMYRKLTKEGVDHSNKMSKAFKHGLEVWEKELSFSYILDPEDFRTFENCYLAFVKYFETFSDDIEPIEVEHYFSEPLVTVDDYDVSFAGKVDCIGKLHSGEEIAIFDDKTTSYSLNAIKEQAHRSAQFLGYSWIASKRSAIPTNIAYVNCVYLKNLKSGLTIQHDRGVTIFSDVDYTEWHKSIINTSYRIVEAHKTNSFPMEFDSCYGKYGRCKYLNLCTMPFYSEEYAQEHFVEREWLIYE